MWWQRLLPCSSALHSERDLHAKAEGLGWSQLGSEPGWQLPRGRQHTQHSGQHRGDCAWPCQLLQPPSKSSLREGQDMGRELLGQLWKRLLLWHGLE